MMQFQDWTQLENEDLAARLHVYQERFIALAQKELHLGSLFEWMNTIQTVNGVAHVEELSSVDFDHEKWPFAYIIVLDSGWSLAILQPDFMAEEPRDFVILMEQEDLLWGEEIAKLLVQLLNRRFVAMQNEPSRTFKRKQVA